MHRFAAWVRGPAPGLFLAIGLALLAAPIGALSIPAGAAGDAPPRPLTESGNTFAVDLYQQLSADRVLLAENRGNLFFSPFSIHTALAMVWFGAAGDTAGEMTAALRLQPGIAQGDFTHQLAAVGGAGGGGAAGSGSPAAGCELSTANGLWGQHDCEFSADYLRILRTAFFAGFDAVDFKRDAAEIAAKINRWVAGQTHDKIKDLIDAGALDRNTRLVLVNAIYFKGRWLDRFEPTDTRDGAFHLTKDQQVQVPTMHRTFASVPYRDRKSVV